ncbi:PhoX family phosphatase [Gloeocapsa sp. PCC 73106]|uniref:PhoX family protein n=1 Tax=Gloeocapsa sp. PCC 73106 TaxID=102232 RepID=UPI0002ABCAC7|nr:alkaline phosphatase PhoX [Gloeocapsa sp. PCC 73106]ELR97147.1 putative phosphatase [Gloeocapsa sp. PCC 73106]
MTLHRRQFLLFFGAAVGTALLKAPSAARETTLPFTLATSPENISFSPVKVPIPLTITGIVPAEQINAYQNYTVVDDLVLPEGFTYQVIASWGDPLGDSRFGYNNDYLAYIATGSDAGLLAINFEYISGQTWMDTYPMVIGKELPFQAVAEAIASKGNTSINAYALTEDDPLKQQIKLIAKEAFIDQGIGIMSLKRNPDGTWERTNLKSDRRITGISGLEDGRYVKSTGPATIVFNKSDKLGYEDNLGDKIIGSFSNCAGGKTPWGTIFSAEENYQDQVPEGVRADGSSLDPARVPFELASDEIYGRANVFGLAGNKYGWMVEVDPANPDDYGTKHTWLGRFRHEAVAVRAVPDKKLAAYSGCDRRGGHVYKFISTEPVVKVDDRSNSRLFAQGMLYGAKFNPDYTGKWIALEPGTPVDPVLPSQVVGTDGEGMVPLPNSDRAQGGFIPFTNDTAVALYKQKFKTLGDLYLGSDEEKQGAILIDAHFAANAAGITCTARPEDAEVTSDGTVFIAFTSENPGGDGGPHKHMAQNPQDPSVPYEYGWVVRIVEDNQNPEALTFRWDALALGGEPYLEGMGFSNPDNLAIDSKGHLWMVTDMSTSGHNQAVPPGRKVEGKPLSLKNLTGIFGNNTAWCIPLTGPSAGNAYPFAIGPTETELCGLEFSPDEKSLFLAVQHPGEVTGIRANLNSETREFALKTTDGQEFIQKREVPLGSNWPGRQANDPPRPSVVAVRRIDNNSIV